MKSTHELMCLKDRVALVTGGAGHIGSVICETLAENGSNVVIIDANKSGCIQTSEMLESKYDVETIALTTDLSNEIEVKKIPETVLDKFGQIDILVNCAALVGTSEMKGWTTPFSDQNTDTWRSALEINLTVPFILSQACSQALTTSGNGSIINIGSIYGVLGPDMTLYANTNMGNPAAYAASKGGLLQLTRWLATVMAPSVRVNSITLGGVYRNQPQDFVSQYIARTPLKRMASEQDIKGAMIFFASDLSAYVTGHNLHVDGGWSVW
ncbi:SDR family oxidoreductase [Methanogenium marinum]|uniref:SDR family oxidoreductase n=1 Tax=Methanogenium marinum TaxID=348610 RepID=A0A9Q4KRE3_9EURY|nr:SDR family oxidoreductase [Methanogenium marinum]MDE4907292.1 SDR family oxidoreductase [Methanogenium marinum]